MKFLSVDMDDNIYKDAKEIADRVNLERNRYINEAVRIYNLFNKSRILKNRLNTESTRLASDSEIVLSDLEKLVDGFWL